MKNKRPLANDEPLKHASHRRPVTRREFLAQGFLSGCAVVAGGGLFSLFANPRQAFAELAPDLQDLKAACGIATQGAGKIPFICFDLAGGASIAGSNVLVGQQGGQLDFLNTAGYNKLGLPGNMIPPILNAQSGSHDFIDQRLGLAFHSDSGMLRGILARLSAGTENSINGAVFPARSENDTANNPHNPLYAINRCGANGSLLSLAGSQSSVSGGNSMAPLAFIDPSVRPTKIDQPSDVTGLVDLGELVGLLDQAEAVRVMESVQRLSDRKLARVDSRVSNDAALKHLLRCGYVKTADLADRFGNPASLDPALDPDIVGPSGIFSSSDFAGNREYRKTASMMKLVINGYAGAGNITMGGYDYHTGERGTGERRDYQAGECIGACLEYARRRGVPLMVYVFSDGSVASNGRLDESEAGRGKGEWTGDNQSTAASFMLVYNPAGRPQLLGANVDAQARHQQIGFMSADASVVTSSTPAANNVNLLVETVVLNYLALHNELGRFDTLFPGHGLGSNSLRETLTAFQPIVNSQITSPL
ncbi:MAG TPA: hypothetical protein VIN71_11555 [Pseudomonadales bacterium]